MTSMPRVIDDISKNDNGCNDGNDNAHTAIYNSSTDRNL